MLSPRARWTLAIGGGLFVGLTIVAAFVLAATTTTTVVTIQGAGAGAAFEGRPCFEHIEFGGAPDAVWNGTLTDGMRFEIPKPASMSTYAYRIEVLGASFAVVSHDLVGTYRTSETSCRDDGGQHLRTIGGEKVARGNGTIYAAFWDLTAR